MPNLNLEPEVVKHLSRIRQLDIFGALMVSFDFERGVLTDSGGLPLSKSEARSLRVLINHHLKKSPKKLCEVAFEVAQTKGPIAVNNMDFEPELYE